MSTEPKQPKPNQGLTATQKISLVAGSLPILYLLPSPANAAIIYKDNTNSFFASYFGPTSVEWDVDGDGNNDFVLNATTSTSTFTTSTFTTTTTFYFIDLDSNGGRNARGVVRNNANAGTDAAIQNLASGFVVGPTLAAGYGFGPSGQSIRTMLYSTSTVGDAFIGGVFGSNFIGFRFETGGGDTLYAWAEMIVSPTNVTIERWAYNDTPGGSIRVGQTEDDVVEPPATVPENSSPLALLAMGAAGVYRWRKKRKSAQVEEDMAA
jgi:hypothetical protein